MPLEQLRFEHVVNRDVIPCPGERASEAARCRNSDLVLLPLAVTWDLRISEAADDEAPDLV
ncbi:MAG: hypothetical protein AABM30_12845 [Actinomycetota bacterium]